MNNKIIAKNNDIVLQPMGSRAIMPGSSLFVDIHDVLTNLFRFRTFSLDKFSQICYTYHTSGYEAFHSALH